MISIYEGLSIKYFRIYNLDVYHRTLKKKGEYLINIKPANLNCKIEAKTQ